jgi:hypothetical protein
MVGQKRLYFVRLALLFLAPAMAVVFAIRGTNTEPSIVFLLKRTCAAWLG